jgi:hypothetical protein
VYIWDPAPKISMYCWGGMTRGSEQPKILKSIQIQTHPYCVSSEEIGWFEVQSSLVSCTECGVFDRQSVHPPAEHLGQDRQPNAQNQADVSQKPLQSLQRGNLYQNSNSIGA